MTKLSRVAFAVISREQPSAYRVRGYLAATVAKHQTTISWVWDVFDQDEHRALRISGEETAKVRHKDAWAAADDAMLQRIAQSSMEQLAAFLTVAGGRTRNRTVGASLKLPSPAQAIPPPRRPVFSAFSARRPIPYRRRAQSRPARMRRAPCRFRGGAPRRLYRRARR